MTDRTPLASAAIRRALAEGLPQTWAGLYGDGLSIYHAIMQGADPDDVLDRWREAKG